MRCNPTQVIAKRSGKTLEVLKAIAADAAKEALNEQAIDIVTRADNKMYLAMLEAGLSPKTVMRVQKTLLEVVEPWFSQFAADTPAQEGVADFALQSRLEAQGVKFTAVQEEL